MKYAMCTLLALTLVGFDSRASAQSSNAAPTAQQQEDANSLAKMLANPVANLWSMTFQFNNIELTNDRWNYNLNFQPVLPVSLTKDVNLLTRPLIPIYNSVPYQTSTGADARSTTFGDWVQLELVSPANSGEWLLGVGPTFIFPTAGSVYTGQGKWQAGPAVVAAYQTKLFIAGIFPQQWWSFAGDATRPSTSQINIQPIATLVFEGGWTVGYSGSLLADWNAPSDNRWTVPVGLGVGKVVNFGPLPVKISLAGQYMVVQPEPVGQRWNVQVQLTPVLPKLIKGALFD